MVERVTEFPHTHMDRRPRKRPRLGWDVLPQAPKVLDLLLKFEICSILLFFGFCFARSGEASLGCVY